MDVKLLKLLVLVWYFNNFTSVAFNFQYDSSYIITDFELELYFLPIRTQLFSYLQSG